MTSTYRVDGGNENHDIIVVIVDVDDDYDMVSGRVFERAKEIDWADILVRHGT